MYKRHSNWDEEKLDIHSDSSGYASNSSGGGAGYAGHGSKDSKQDYHKSEMYNSTKPDEDKIKGSYGSNELKADDKKKEDDDKTKTIVDTVDQEEKYQKKDQEEEEFKSIAKDFQQSSNEHEKITDQNNINLKKKQNKSIEDAIKDAIKEEKEIVHVD